MGARMAKPLDSNPHTPQAPLTPQVANPLVSTPDFSNKKFEGWTATDDDAVTGFREFDKDGDFDEWDFPASMQQAKVGADRSQCQIVIPLDGISRVHLRLERTLNALRVYDMKSKNGTSLRGSRLEPLVGTHIDVGDLITLQGSREVVLFALNDAMKKHRSTVLDILGTGYLRTTDQVMQDAAQGSNPLLLVGDASSCVTELASLIHRISPRRKKPLVHVLEPPSKAADGSSLVKSADKSTLVLALRQKAKPLKAAFVNALTSKSYSGRLIVVADSPQDARSALGEDFSNMLLNITIRPLAYRRQDIPALIDRHFARSTAPTLRFADLTSENQHALREGRWERNLVRLRQVVDTLAAYTQQPGYRGAAKAVGKSLSSAWRLLHRVGLRAPLFA